MYASLHHHVKKCYNGGKTFEILEKLKADALGL
jgi:hypothetical protein